MKILVCIKQIPDTQDVKWSKDNNIIRDGTISILNPYDELAILAAKKIRADLNNNAKITLISMGPDNARQSIEFGLALGADEGILLSDKKFSGADTLATAKTLYYAIRNHIKDYDLIVTGQFAQDGDTAQTPYSLANLLGIPQIGYVSEVLAVKETGLVVKSVKDNGVYEMKGNFPLLISVSKFEGEVYTPGVFDYIRAQNSEITVLTAEDIGADLNSVGITGSPTCVKRAFRPENRRNCKFIDKKDLINELK